MLQPDGKLVIGGTFATVNGAPRYQIARLNADGSLDPTFNGGTGLATVQALALQADGKVLVGGFSWSGSIARLNSDGTSDPSFSIGTGFGVPFNNFVMAVTALAVQTDGKILAGGTFTNYNGTLCNGLARLNTDGALDTGFSGGTRFDNTVFSLAVQADGKILASGSFNSYNGTSRKRIARLNADGTLDTGFGIATGFEGSSDYLYSIALQSDGKILVGGQFSYYAGISRGSIARLNSDGNLDAGFNVGTGFSSPLIAVGVQPDGKVLAGGFFDSYNGTPRTALVRLNADGTVDSSLASAVRQVATVYTTVPATGGKWVIGGDFTHVDGTACNRIARLNGDGSLDPSFSFNARVNKTDGVYALAVQADGKTLAGGNSFVGYDGTFRGSIVRLHTDGNLDTSFGIFSDLNGGPVYALALQTDGRILAGGFGYSSNSRRIARLNANGSLDTTFKSGTELTLGSGYGWVTTFAVQADGKVIVGGNFTGYNGTPVNRLARLNMDGNLDPSFSVGTGFDGLVYSLALQMDGKILVGGFFNNYNGTSRNYIARVNTDGALDSSFNIGTGFNNVIAGLKLQADGKVVAGGLFTSYNGTSRNSLARLNADGTLDVSFAAPTVQPSYTTASLPLPSVLLFTADGNLLLGGVGPGLSSGRSESSLVLFEPMVAPVITSLLAASGTVGSSFTYAIMATNTPTNYSATGLPAGLSINTATGIVSGMPTLAGAFQVSMTATNAAGTSPVAILSLTVAKAPLTVIAEDKSRAYGASNPALTVTYAGFVNGDTASSLNTAPVAASSATVTSNAGTYAITASGGVSANYAFNYVPGTLTVTKAPLTVRADDKVKGVGTNNPALTMTFTGFVNGETAAVLDLLPSISTTATIASPVGTYPITLTGGIDDNYSFLLQGGTLTVNEPLLITSASMATFVVGAANSFTFTTSGTPAPTFSVSAGTLPAWGTLNATSGVLSGTPPNTVGAPFTFTVTASNGAVPDATQNFTLQVVLPNSAPTITTQPLAQTVNAGATATFTIAASGTPAPSYQWQRQASGTTGFVNVANIGVYSGTTTATLTITGATVAMRGDQFHCVASNGVSPEATSNAVTLTVNDPPQITSANTATFTAGQAGSFIFTASGTPAPTFSITGGALPSWATLNPTTGMISGTPPNTIGSPFTFSITAANGVSPNATLNFTLTVGLPLVFYVNDNSQANDAWCTAVGNDANDGLSPAAPKATVQAILSAYDLEPGDIVRIDTGTYTLTSNIIVGSTDGGSASAPVVFEGSPYGTIINRNSTSSSAYAWSVGAPYVTLRTASSTAYPALAQSSMKITGGDRVMYLTSSATGCRLSRLQLAASAGYGACYVSGSDCIVENCLVMGGITGIYLSSSTLAVSTVRNCTIVGFTVNGIACVNASVLNLSNTIVVGDGVLRRGLYLSIGSALASSNYNDLVAMNGAIVGYAGGVNCETLTAWQSTTVKDTNSISLDPRFVSATDYHLQSTAGSYHDGTWTPDAGDSPGIDAGDPASAVGSEPLPNGGRINLGAFGGTEQGSRTVVERLVQVVSPNGGENLAGTFRIRWQATGRGWQAGDTVKLEYSVDGGTAWQAISGAASLAFNAGQFDWNTTTVIGSGCRIRVSANGGSGATDASDGPALLRNVLSGFYVPAVF